MRLCRCAVLTAARGRVLAVEAASTPAEVGRVLDALTVASIAVLKQAVESLV